MRFWRLEVSEDTSSALMPVKSITHVNLEPLHASHARALMMSRPFHCMNQGTTGPEQFTGERFFLLVFFVKECLVVDEDLYVDPEATPDIEDPNLFAQKLQALYEDVLANVTECLMYVYIYVYTYTYKDRI